MEKYNAFLNWAISPQLVLPDKLLHHRSSLWNLYFRQLIKSISWRKKHNDAVQCPYYSPVLFSSPIVSTLEQIHKTKSVIMTTKRSISQIKNPKKQRGKKGRRKTKQKTSKVVRQLFDRLLLVLQHKKSKKSKAPFCLVAVIPSLHPAVQHCFPP